MLGEMQKSYFLNFDQSNFYIQKGNLCAWSWWRKRVCCDCK